MKNIRQLITALVMVMAAAVLVVPAFAQDNTTPTPPADRARPTSRTITITQEQINTLLTLRPGDRLKDLSITLGENQITAAFTTKGMKNRGTGKAIVAVVTPAVSDGKINWTLNSLSIDGQAAPQDQLDRLTARVSNMINSRLPRHERHFTVTSLSVNSSAITLTLTRILNI